MKTDLKIVQSQVEPRDKNVIWLDTKTNKLKIFGNKGWESLSYEIEDITKEEVDKIKNIIGINNIEDGEGQYSVKGGSNYTNYSRGEASIAFGRGNISEGRNSVALGGYINGISLSGSNGEYTFKINYQYSTDSVCAITDLFTTGDFEFVTKCEVTFNKQSGSYKYYTCKTETDLGELTNKTYAVFWVKASGNDSIALQGSYASGFGSLAAGFFSSATGEQAISLGYGNQNRGRYSLCLGIQNQNLSTKEGTIPNNFLIGYRNIVSDVDSYGHYIFGGDNKVNKSGDIIFGLSNITEGGNYSKRINSIFGSGNEAKGDNSAFIMGYYNKSNKQNGNEDHFIIGKYNEDKDNAFLEIADGNSSKRHNVITLDRDGTIDITPKEGQKLNYNGNEIVTVNKALEMINYIDLSSKLESDLSNINDYESLSQRGIKAINYLIDLHKKDADTLDWSRSDSYPDGSGDWTGELHANSSSFEAKCKEFSMWTQIDTINHIKVDTSSITLASEYNRNTSYILLNKNGLHLNAADNAQSLRLGTAANNFDTSGNTAISLVDFSYGHKVFIYGDNIDIGVPSAVGAHPNETRGTINIGEELVQSVNVVGENVNIRCDSNGFIQLQSPLNSYIELSDEAIVMEQCEGKSHFKLGSNSLGIYSPIVNIGDGNATVYINGQPYTGGGSTDKADIASDYGIYSQWGRTYIGSNYASREYGGDGISTLYIGDDSSMGIYIGTANWGYSSTGANNVCISGQNIVLEGNLEINDKVGGGSCYMSISSDGITFYDSGYHNSIFLPWGFSGNL